MLAALLAATPAALAMATTCGAAQPPGGAGAEVAAAPYPRPAGAYAVDSVRTTLVPMRDGVRLATDVYRPAGVAGPLPTVLMRLPYNKAAYRGATGPAAFFASHGYAVVLQDVRGKFASEGAFRVYAGDRTDWADTFDWVAAQPWSSGRIGTYGCSYLGEEQILAAPLRHPHHVAAIAQAAGGNLGRVGRHRSFWGSVEGGAFALSINFGWMPVFASVDRGARPAPHVDLPTFLRTLPVLDMTERAGSPSWDWRNFLTRAPDDPWWDRQGYLTSRDRVGVATLHVSSWFDLADQALTEAALFRANGVNDRARTGQYVIISPTTHCASEAASGDTRVGDLPVGDARLHYWETYLAWFDRWLRGTVHALDALPRVQYYTIGRNAWRAADRWPVPGMRATAFYLRSGGGANTRTGDGRLSLAPSTRAGRAAEPPDTFTYDPADPVPSRGGAICCTGNPKDQPGSYDNADLEQRADVLVYTGDVLREGLELTGPMRAEVYVSSDAPDTDVTVKLLDVFPDGRAMNIQEGITRARWRGGFARPRPMRPGVVYRVPVGLHATSWYLPPGHRLRAEVSSSSFPRFDRNLNTGGRNYDETAGRVAHTAVHHAGAYASRVVLPVVR
ncbi:hydrolase [Gemmatimonadetes bacterium T265]|nr:hydrolase [Gemmatimonadetes bacterium T265]